MFVAVSVSGVDNEVRKEKSRMRGYKADVKSWKISNCWLFVDVPWVILFKYKVDI